MDDALFCESSLAWACCGDYHADEADRNGAFYYRNPYQLATFEFFRAQRRRGVFLNLWLRDVMDRHRAQLDGRKAS